MEIPKSKETIMRLPEDFKKEKWSEIESMFGLKAIDPKVLEEIMEMEVEDLNQNKEVKKLESMELKPSLENPWSHIYFSAISSDRRGRFVYFNGSDSRSLFCFDTSSKEGKE